MLDDLPRHEMIDGFERIAPRRQGFQALISIEKSQLPHHRLCESKSHASDSHRSGEAAIFRGAHKFALEYCARLLRFTVAHHGPVRDHEIHPELRRDAMAELLGFLQGEMDVAGREGTFAFTADIGTRARASGSRASGRAKAKSKWSS